MEHHFIPRFYLKAFRDPSIPGGQGPWLWVSDFKEQVVERRAPKNVGKATNYYAFPEWEATGEGGKKVPGVFSNSQVVRVDGSKPISFIL